MRADRERNGRHRAAVRRGAEDASQALKTSIRLCASRR